MKALAAGLLLIVGAISAGDETPPKPTAQERDAAIDGALKWMKTYRTFPQLSVWWDFDYECLHGKSDWGVSHAQVETRRQGEKLRTIPLLTYVNIGDPLRRDTTWDGKKAMIRDYSAAEVPRRITILPEIHPWTLVFRFYDDLLFSPEGKARQLEMQRFGKVPLAQSDYWLPSALERNRNDLKLQPQHETVAERKCVVLSLGDHDRFWIAPELGHAICKREVMIVPGERFTEGLVGTQRDTLERTVMSEFKQIEGLWMPHRIVRELFIPGEQPNERVLFDRKTLSVKMISASPFDESEFRLPTPDGVEVLDQTK
jgi:hypothetical protein